MNFFDLRQNGLEIQEILDSMQDYSDSLKEIETKLNKIPIINILEENYNISSKITNSGIYYIPSVNIDKTKITPTTLSINSDYTIIIHLQNVSNGINYRSQYLITQDMNMNMVFYKRDTNSDGDWTDFVNLQVSQKNEILNYLKIKSFS